MSLLPACCSDADRVQMKKFLSIFLCLALICCLTVTAFAADEPAEETVEEVIDVVDVTEDEVLVAEAPADDSVADEDAAPADEEPAEAAEEETEEEAEPAVEEAPAKKGISGPMKALIAAAILCGFGGVVIFLGNKKTKAPKKPAKKD